MCCLNLWPQKWSTAATCQFHLTSSLFTCLSHTHAVSRQTNTVVHTMTMQRLKNRQNLSVPAWNQPLRRRISSVRKKSKTKVFTSCSWLTAISCMSNLTEVSVCVCVCLWKNGKCPVFIWCFPSHCWPQVLHSPIHKVTTGSGIIMEHMLGYLFKFHAQITVGNLTG